MCTGSVTHAKDPYTEVTFEKCIAFGPHKLQLDM